jgi:hypothetical protein
MLACNIILKSVGGHKKTASIFNMFLISESAIAATAEGTYGV